MIERKRNKNGIVHSLSCSHTRIMYFTHFVCVYILSYFIALLIYTHNKPTDHHPIIIIQACCPHQPHRRGNVGAVSIRIMVAPTQPLWRLFAEIVLRLPIVHPSGKDASGKGRGRLWWKIETSTTTTNTSGEGDDGKEEEEKEQPKHQQERDLYRSTISR